MRGDSMDQRPKSFLVLFGRYWGWFALIPLLIGLVFGAVGYSLSVQAQRLEAYGVDTVGVILAKDWREDRSRDSDGNTRTTVIYEVTYEFEAGSAGQIERVSSVSRDFYDRAEVRGSIALRYDSTDPSVVEIERGSTAILGLVFSGVGVVVGLIGLAIAVGVGLSVVRVMRLRDTGAVRQAEVTGYRTANVTVNDRALDKAVWRDEVGAVGATWSARMEKLPEIGARIKVFVDPQRPEKSVWEGDVGPRG